MSLAPALVLGTDTPIGLSVIRELGGHGVPVHGIGKRGSIGAASRHCARFTMRPAGPMAEWLPGIVAQSGAAALFAISENDLIALAALPENIGACRILTPRAGPLGIVLDKRRTLAIAASLGIDTPASWQPAAGDDFVERARLFEYPVVVKWADPAHAAPTLAAHGLPLVKAEFARDPAGLVALLGRYAPTGAWPLVQHYCPGVGLGQMLFMEAGAPVLVFQHRRLREWPPEGGVSTDCAAEPLDRHRDQMARSAALLAAIGWQGLAMVEYRFDAARGRYWLMEVNGRFWGSLPLARASGAHFAWEAYRRAVLGARDAAAPAPAASVRARYLLPATRRLARVLFRRAAIADPNFVARPLADLVAYIAGFLDPRVHPYVMSLDDPGPMLRDAFTIARKALRWGRLAKD